VAWSEVETEIINPGGSAGRKGKTMAKKLSDKQIRFFGTAAQRAGLKRRRAAARANSGKKKKSFKKPASRPAHRPRTATPHKQNPVPQIIGLTLGNAARKGTVMAKSATKKKKSFAGAHRAASGMKKTKKKYFRGRRGNPGALGSVMDWVKGGVGGLAGVVVTRGLPQVVLADKNQGGIGYLANGVTAALAGWVSHLVFPRERVVTASVLAGGFAALLARIIGDFTTYGKYLALTGVGDYMVWNGVTPQRLQDPNSAMMEVPAGWGAPPPALVMQSSGADMMGAGMDAGRRAGVC
jgi:hypothetical protein